MTRLHPEPVHSSSSRAKRGHGFSLGPWISRVVVLVAVWMVLISPVSSFAQFRLRNFPGLRQQKSRYEPLREQGFDHYQKGQYQKAIELADQIIAGEPEHPVAYYLRASAKIELGRAARDRKQIRDGIQDARKALALRGNDDEFASLYIPYVYGMSSLAVVERHAAHADMAAKAATPVIERPKVSRSDKSNLLYQRAFAYEQANLVHADKHAKTSPTAEQQQKFLKEQADRREAAIRDYSRAITLNSKHLGAHINLAKAYAASGKKERALEAYGLAIQEFPRNPLVFNDRGTFYRQLGQLDDAIADYTLATEIQRNFIMGYINRGYCLVDKGEDQAAEADFEMAISLSPKMSLAYSLRGTARMAQGKAEPAIADFTHQLTLNSRDATAYANRGFARFFAGQFESAAGDFHTALKLQPQALHLGAWRHLALARAGQAEQSKPELESFLASPTGPKGWVAEVCSYLSGKTSAEDLLAAAKTDDERTATARQCEAEFFIGEQKMIDGDSDAARPHFQASVETGARYLSAFRGARYELNDFNN